MSRMLRRRVIGALVLATLLGGVAWQFHEDIADMRAYTLLPLEPEAVDRIEVTLQGHPPEHFERREGRWSGDAHSPEDLGRIEELASLAATPVDHWQPASDFVPARIGLAPPSAILVLNDQRVEFGEMTALGKQRYARVGERIAFVPAQALPRAPRTASLPTATNAP
ncbi:hypothetical protein FHW69_000893 [Luteibacter sp. Sphag1AF]|uniref:hypothetical protein n=1 Tax=Luteibacter sp. Sphag1AF TaxID=2587031 RepID=UPI0016093903|nr:hypothetical protein [Luteibacter sp. Sphag1AF]MBB3226303.1 hypothetical protein [Luteibacter sp. Sphag1AF]